MNAKDLLNMDMETAIQWLLHFWRWWTGELASMLPQEWRERLSRRIRTTAEMKGDALVYRNAETGQVLGTKPRGRIEFLMSPNQVLTRELDLPLLPLNDVKRMIALDLDRITPFQPEQVYFDADIVSRDQEAGRQLVAVGIVPRDTAVAILTAVQAKELSPSALGVQPRDGEAAPAFDFLASMRDVEGGSASQRRAVYLWIGAAALLAANLALLTWRDSTSLDQLRQAVESQAAPVAVAMRTRDRVDHEAARRTQLIDLKEKLSPLPVLDAVTAVMPMDAWVRRFEWNGKIVHIIGARKTSQDILARLEASPYLRNAKSLSSDNHVDAAGYTAFDMQAEREFPKTRIAAAVPAVPAPHAAPTLPQPFRPGMPVVRRPGMPFGPGMTPPGMARPGLMPPGLPPGAHNGIVPRNAAPPGTTPYGAKDDSSDDDDDDDDGTPPANAKPVKPPHPFVPGARKPVPIHPHGQPGQNP
jgi:general secretion pathway protein L